MLCGSIVHSVKRRRPRLVLVLWKLGQRPEPGGGHGIQVLVVIKFLAATPALAQIIGPGGNLYLSQNSVAEQLYF